MLATWAVEPNAYWMTRTRSMRQMRGKSDAGLLWDFRPWCHIDVLMCLLCFHVGAGVNVKQRFSQSQPLDLSSDFRQHRVTRPTECNNVVLSAPS